MTLDFALQFTTLIMDFDLSNSSERTKNCTGLFMIVTNILVTIYIYGILFYYGTFKDDFRIKINNIKQKLEKRQLDNQ
jgi:hypothetical protein